MLLSANKAFVLYRLGNSCSETERKSTEKDGTILECSFGPSTLVSVNCRA